MSKIIKILINKRDYTDYQFIEPETKNSLKNEDYSFIDPIKDKLFTRDYLSVTDNKFTLDYSYVRESCKMAESVKKCINFKRIPYLPNELVNYIADYLDYEKYYKPGHSEKMRDVIEDIIDMGEIFRETIEPKIAKLCWGGGLKEVMVAQTDTEWL